MKYTLKDGDEIVIRYPQIEDAAGITALMKTADKETLFLAREPGEFITTEEQEREIIMNVLNSNDVAWFVAEYNGEIVGQCSIGLVRGYKRYRHRAEVAFVLYEKYCNRGIGGKMMQECLIWCGKHGVSQVELDVVTTNVRAIKMYQSFGFEIVGTIPDALKYQNDTTANEYYMVCQL
ncbi:MAG: GNAT family N-acetyltransferase [Lachnospiraceae bacterium]|nr:GNAT family N-acetyltransferase [Lachnospiraceae bacterium]